jgi:hypothetical protein
MKKNQELGIMIITAAAVLIILISLYFLLQNKAFYRHTLKQISIENYYRNDQQIVKGSVPYTRFNPEQMFHWDAALYRQIRDHGYQIKAAGGDFIFAFFPLFPAIWKITGLSAPAISLLNYLLWIIALIILVRSLLPPDQPYRIYYFAALLGSPMLFVFLIPYTEGVFMISTTIALWGILRNRYIVYFLAASFASTARSSVMILSLAILFTEVYFLLQTRKLWPALRSLALKILPLALGTGLVSFIQRAYGSDHLFKFALVQKYWDYRLRLPGPISDWAHEQFCTNLPLAGIVLPVIITFLAFGALKHLRRYWHKAKTETSIPHSPKEYLFILSLIYIAGSTLAILLYRGGCLNGISRYSLCTPFFPILLLIFTEKTAAISARNMGYAFSIAFLAAIIALSLFPYSKRWGFSDLGFFILFAQMCLFAFPALINKKSYLIGLLLVASLWATYLFNMFIADAWILT